MKTLFITLALLLVTSLQATPFYYIALNADGSAQTNYVTMQSWPPNGSGFTTYGTNIIFGANAIYTNVPNASGFFSNWLYPGLYRVSIPAKNAGFFANILDTTNYASLAFYATNTPPTQTGGSGFTIITNWLGYTPVAPTFPGVTNALGFGPTTNSLYATNPVIYVSSV